MNKKIEVLVDIIKEEVKKEVVAEMKGREKPPIALLAVYNGNMYAHLDGFCDKNIEYFGLNADNFKRELYQKGLIDFNGSRYVPHGGMEAVAVLSSGRLYVNRDLIDSMLMLHLVERMSIKNIKEAFEERVANNKSEFIKELYNVSNAEFQRNSPMFTEVRLGVNSKSQIEKF
ncbi:MAG: hypothetical protein ACRCZ0_08365 [Cetobacterium sp.]